MMERSREIAFDRGKEIHPIRVSFHRRATSRVPSIAVVCFMVLVNTIIPALAQAGTLSGRGNFPRVSAATGFWTACDSGLTTSWIYSLAINHSGVIFAGTAGSVFDSKDNGVSWHQPGSTNNMVYSLAINPSGYIFAGTQNNGVDSGVYVSTTNLSVWAQTSSFRAYAVNALAINSSGYIFAGTSDGGTGGTVYLSTNGGTNWAKVSKGLPNTQVTCLAINSLGYVFAGTYGGGIYLSTNNGGSWTEAYNGYGVYCLAIDSSDDIFAGTADGVYVSTNSGSTWIQGNNGLTNTQVNSLVIDTNGDILAGTWGGGVFIYRHSGTSWAQVGLAGMQIYSLAASTSGYIFAGTNGNGIYRAAISTLITSPTLVSPSSGSAGISTAPSLKWDVSSGAVNYRLQVSTDSTFATTTYDTSGLTTTSDTVSGLSYLTKYYWRVNASDSAGTSDWSQVWNFITQMSPPSVPVLASPVTDSTGVSTIPTFEWNRAAGAATYRLQVSTDSLFTGIVRDSSGITDTSTTISGLSYSTKYYWRLSAVNSTGPSGWSHVWSFTTGNAPRVAPTLLSPGNGEMNVPTGDTLTWTVVIGARSYWVQVSEDSTFQGVVWDSVNDTASSAYVSGLKSGTKYYWEVFSCFSTGDTIGSKVWNFTTLSNAPIFPPAISSFSPTSGPVGTSVTITGTNFNSTASNDVVYFGAVKALVTAASSNSLTVSVPPGATYQPITVTDVATGLTGYANRPFATTFSTGYAFNDSSFSRRLDVQLKGSPTSLAVADLNGDGKPDVAMVTMYNGLEGLFVYRNTSTRDSISFAPSLALLNGEPNWDIAIGDVDGDGKPDIVVATRVDSVFVFRNTSSGDSITFAPRMALPVGTGDFPFVCLRDLDGDGKPDLVITNSNGEAFWVFHNTSTIGNISFASKGSYGTGGSPYGVAVGDLDGDGKPDIVVANDSSNTVSVFRNTSTPGNISFGPRADLATGAAPWGVALGEFDGDGKLDIAVTDNGDNTLSIFRNTSSVGNLSFSAKVSYPTVGNPAGISIGDLDGDSKPDILIGSSNGNGLSISAYRNLGAAGSTSFAGKVDFEVVAPGGPMSVAIGDIDGDGRPDLLSVSFYSSTLSAMLNTVSGATVLPLAPINPTPLNDSTGVLTDLTLKWGSSAGAMSYGLQLATDSTFVSTATLKDTSGLTNASFSISKLEHYKKYYWHVNATDSAGTSPWSDVWCFTTIPLLPPIAPKLGLPDSGSAGIGTSPTLTWQRSVSAEWYELQVSTDPGFGSNHIYLDKPDLTDTSRVVSDLSTGTAYYWRVIARDSAGTSPWSNVWSFTTFVYPQTIQVSNRFVPPGTSDQSNYRIIGLPGSDVIPVSNILSGNEGTDWEVYWDNGNAQDYQVKYDGSSTFDLSPGRAFWIFSRQQFGVSQSETTVPLDSNDSYAIPLHAGWNLISNPFETSIPWSSVQDVNGGANLVQPLVSFSGDYLTASSLDPYSGYYFYNKNDVASLEIPYVYNGTGQNKPAGSHAEVSSIQHNVVNLSLSSGKMRVLPVNVGFDAAVSDTLNNLNVFAPPDNFDRLRIQVVDQSVRGYWKKLYSDFREKVGKGQSFDIEVKNLTGGAAAIRPVVPDGFQNYDVYLADEGTHQFYDLKTTDSIAIGGGYRYKSYTLLIGDGSFIDSVRAFYAPRTYELFQNYPNPFNPATIIRYEIPKRAQVTVRVYNVLGELVRTLVNQVQQPGYYEVDFNGIRLATGVYFCTLSAGNYHQVKKMLLLK